MKSLILGYSIGAIFVLGAWSQVTPGAELVPVTRGPANDSEARYSPDGRSVVFQSDRSGTLDLHVADLETGKVWTLHQAPGHACFPVYSPDGKSVVYAYAHFTKTAFKNNDEGYNLFAISADGKGEPRQITFGRFRDYAAEFHPDGKTLYFSSNRSTGKALMPVMLYRVPFTGGEPELALQKNGDMVQPSFSFDGKFIAFGNNSGFLESWSIRVSRTKTLLEYSGDTDSTKKNVWDLSADFSEKSNPSGFWSYRYMKHDRVTNESSTKILPPDTSKAELLTRLSKQHERGLLNAWCRPKIDWPYIGIAPVSGQSGVPWAVGEMGAHAGDRGGSVLAIARWTAPHDGDIIVTGIFQGILNGNRDFYLILNHTKVLESQFSFRHTELPFRHRLRVKEGDTIDMCVGRGTALPSSMSKIEETIYYVSEDYEDEHGEYLPLDHNSDLWLSSDGKESYYGPRWSPKDHVIACTGYRAGDRGWNAYLIDARSGEKTCLTADVPGNSRSPSWAPDGGSVIFENNQTGSYRLYRRALSDTKAR